MFSGLTWDHPRGYDALAQAEKQVNAGRTDALLHWSKQPLEGFESAPIAELAGEHDLLVLDHPHIGEAVANDCLHPLEDLYSTDQIEAWKAQSIGPSFASYHWQNRTWALPLDVATQVMVRRADTVPFAPRNWDEVVDLAAKQPVAQSLAGPHALLTLFSTVAGMGGHVGGDALLADDLAKQALATMHRLYALRPKGSERLNPIGLSEALARGQIALVPLLFGYVTYAKAGAEQLTFSDTIGVQQPGTGGVLGGTGIAFCKHSTPTQELLDHIAWLMHPQTQRAMMPAHGGQPSARSAWQDRAVNEAWGGFYIDCAKTAENALLRPRFDGYIAFQTQASARIRQALEMGEDETTTAQALRVLWSAARAAAKGPLETD